MQNGNLLQLHKNPLSNYKDIKYTIITKKSMLLSNIIYSWTVLEACQ